MKILMVDKYFFIKGGAERYLFELTQILQKYGGKLAETGSVKWLFERKGVIIINLKSFIYLWVYCL